MGSEGIFGVLVGMVSGSVLGIIVANGLKLITRRPILTRWPILAFAIFGGLLPALVQHWRYQ